MDHMDHMTDIADIVNVQYAEGVDGLFYYKRVIPKDFNNQLLEFLQNSGDWTYVNPKNKKSRRVIHYGYSYNYKKKNDVQKITEFPPIINNLRNLISLHGISEEQFNQCIINEYKPGQGISSHTDSFIFGHTICCFSLGSTTIMKFTKGDEVRELFVKPRSLYIMTGDSRYRFKHEMPPRTYDIRKTKTYERETRYSITFRIV